MTRFAIFPVGPHKRPLIDGWQAKATRDPHVIAQWEAHGAVAWGVPCGPANDLFVIDLDCDRDTGEPVGEATLRAGPYARLLDGPSVLTPTGGRHLYLRHFDGARNTQGKIGPKVDTRGEGGYVVAAGSRTEGGPYIVQGADLPLELPPVPVGLRALLLHRPSPPKVGRFAHHEAPTGEVEELLSYIPPDAGYGDWVAVLMALHARYGGSDEGLALADRWSAQGSKYRPGEVAAKWRGFKRSGVSWATVPALARQNGADLSTIARRWAA